MCNMNHRDTKKFNIKSSRCTLFKIFHSSTPLLLKLIIRAVTVRLFLSEKRPMLIKYTKRCLAIIKHFTTVYFVKKREIN